MSTRYLAGLLLGSALLLSACGGAAVRSQAPSAATSSAPAVSAKASAAAKPSAAAASTAAKPAAAGSKIVVSYSTVSPDDLPVWVAQDQGVFAANGLNVDLQFIASNTGVAALVSNQIQASAVGGSEVLAAVLGGANLEVLATLSPVFPYKLIAAPSIKTVQDLKGKTLGIARVGSSSDLGTRAALQKVGLVPDKDVKILQVGSGPNRTAGLKSGSIQAAVTQPPDTTILERLGFHSLVDLTSLNIPNANTVIAANRAWVTANPKLAQQVVDAVIQGTARMKQDKAQSVKILEKYYKSDDAEAMGQAFDYYAGQVIASQPYPKSDQFQIALQELAKETPPPSGFKLESMLNASFVENAVSRGLDKA